MRLFTLILAGLLALIQYPLWLGKGGWFRAWELDRQLVAQRATNERLRARNGALDGEVRDLRQGLVAVEERARYELGMIRADEFFVQLSGRPETAEAGGGATPTAAGAEGQLIVSDPGGADPSSANSSAASTASKR